MIVREIITALGFDIDEKKLKAFDASVEQVKSGLEELAGITIGTAGFLFEFVKTSAESAEHLIKLAHISGISAETLQRLGKAAVASGMDIDELAFGLKFLSRNLYEASKNPTGEIGKSFRTMGIRTKDANGKLKETSEVIAEMSDKFTKLPSRTEKAALAIKFFGRSGGNMIELLEQGSARIRELSQGDVLSNKQLEDLKEFNISLKRVLIVIKYIKSAVSAELAPSLTKVIDGFREFLQTNKDIIKSNVLAFMKALTGFVGTMWKSVRFLGMAFAYLAEKLGGVERVTKAVLYGLTFIASAQVVFGILAAASAFGALAAAMEIELAPLALLAAGIVAAAAVIFLVVEDIVSYFQGKKSITGIIVDKFSEAFDYIKDKFKELESFFDDNSEGLFGKLAKLDFLSPKMREDLQWLEDKFTTISGLLSTMMQTVQYLIPIYGPIKAAMDLNSGFGSFLNSLPNPAPTGPTPPGLFPQNMVPFGKQEPVSGIQPGNMPAGGTNTSQVIIQAPINVTVPAGTDPGMVGEKVKVGISDGVAAMLRFASRATS